MFTINQGLNGGWYGCVSADTADDARAAAEALADILTSLRAANPKHAKTVAVTAAALSTKGEACLAYCTANPRCTHDQYTAAGHTLRTVKWLRANGYLQSVDGKWVVDRDGGLDKAGHPER